MKIRYVIYFLLGIWPILSLGLVVSLAGLHRMDANYTNNLDEEFWISASSIMLGHLIAYSVPVIPTLFFRWKNKTPFILLGSIGGFVLLMQLTMRFMADSLGRLDCANNCVVSVMPAGPGMFLNVMTCLMLISLLGLFFLIAYLRRDMPRASDSSALAN